MQQLYLNSHTHRKRKINRFVVVNEPKRDKWRKAIVFCKEKRMLWQADLRKVIGHVPPGYFRGMGNADPPEDPQKLQTGRLEL